MIVGTFVRWTRTAPAGDRAKAAAALVRAYLRASLSAEDTRAAEAAMSILLDDPSPRVRLALALGLGASERAPRAVVTALARDQIEVAGHVVPFSPVLSDGDLVDLVAEAGPGLQSMVAHRAGLSPAVCAALAEVGGRHAVLDLLDNAGARPAQVSLRRIAERFGRDGEVRGRLLARQGLACDIRDRLVEGCAAALADLPLVTATLGARRAARVGEEARLCATLALAEEIAAHEMPALVEHLRVSGRLTPAFLMHALCVGHVDFFAAAIAGLSAHSPARVRGILVDGRRQTIGALYAAAGLTGSIGEVFADATLMWRAIARAPEGGDAGDVAERLIMRYGAAARRDPLISDLLMLVERLNLAHRRHSARDLARRMAGGDAAGEDRTGEPVPNDLPRLDVRPAEEAA